MTTKNSHMVNFRLPDSFSLNNTECRVLLLAVNDLFHAVAANEIDTYFKYHPEVETILNKLEKHDGAETQ